MNRGNDYIQIYHKFTSLLEHIQLSEDGSFRFSIYGKATIPRISVNIW